jgi:ribosomal-protein-alanine N-acetyltransferase
MPDDRTEPDARAVGPCIDTERLHLRPLTEADAEALARLFAQPEVVRYSGGHSPSLDEVREGLRRHIAAYYGPDGYGLLAVELADTGEVVGRVGLLTTELDATADVELHYHLMREAWGNGLATEAACAVLDWARRERGVRRVVAAIHPENQASQRVAEKCGLSFWKEMVIPDAGVCMVYRVEWVDTS